MPESRPFAEPAPGRQRPSNRQNEALTGILNDLRSIPTRPQPLDITPARLAQLLRELAPAVYARVPRDQISAITTVAAANGIPAATLAALAREAGTLLARTTHTGPPEMPGTAALNRLLTADLSLTAELLLARTTLTTAVAHSDPDLPRLWILINGLHNLVPADMLTTLPARSHGPIARLVPTHDDLIDWSGVRRAVEELQHTVTAATQGRRWVLGLPARTNHDSATADQQLIALGVLDLTHPRTAHELLLARQTTPELNVLRLVLSSLPPVTNVLDLSDPALKAICDRNNWLLGTSNERTQHDLIRRRASPSLNRDIRTHLASGDTTSLTLALIERAPTDHDLDRITWPRQPPAADTVQRRHLLNIASRTAIHHFTGIQIEPHLTRSAAFAGRFPEKITGQNLRVGPDELLAHHTPNHPSAMLNPREPPDLGPGL